jgi:hypothetical protein
VTKETVEMCEYKDSNCSESIEVLYLNHSNVIHCSMCINLKNLAGPHDAVI